MSPELGTCSTTWIVLHARRYLPGTSRAVLRRKLQVGLEREPLFLSPL